MSSRIEPKHVAMLAQGTEVYGIGTIEKIYAEAWADMTTVCMARGSLHDWLCERGANVELVDGLAQFRLSRTARAITSFPSRWRQAKRDARRIHERLAGRGVRVIHAHWLPQQLIAGHMRRLGYKSVWQINNNMNRRRWFDSSRRVSHCLARWGADLLLPASDYIADNWRGCGVNMTTIRNAAPPLRQSVSPSPDSPPIRCLVAGRLEASKGHHVAVEAVLLARKQGHNVVLDIYGGPVDDNAYADELRKMARDHEAEDAVRFMGFCDDLRQRHAGYHLGFQCRVDPEPCSLWVCETMVDGLPVLASATGGTPELVDNGVTGVLVPPGDAVALGEQLIRLCNEMGKLDEMRRAAFERGQEHFLTSRMLRQTLEAYQTLAAGS